MKILSSALVLVTSLSKLNFGQSKVIDQDVVQITSDGKDSGGTAIAAASSNLRLIEAGDEANVVSDTDITSNFVTKKTSGIDDKISSKVDLMLENLDLSHEMKKALSNAIIASLHKADSNLVEVKSGDITDWVDGRIDDHVSTMLEDSGLSNEVKDTLRNTIAEDSLAILVALFVPSRVIEQNENHPHDSDLNTEDVNLGWAQTWSLWCWSPWGCDRNWEPVSFDTVTQDVSPSFTVEMATDDDLAGDKYMGGLVATLNNFLFPLQDTHAAVDHSTLEQVMLELNFTDGALPVSYNSDFHMFSDESLTRAFFYGLGSVLIAKQEEVSSSSFGPFEVDMPLHELQVREGFRSYGARVHFGYDQQVTAIFDYGEDKLVQPGEVGWNDAKILALVTMTTLVTAREHLTWSHFLCANTAALHTARYLPPHHPIRRLLTPFTYHTNAVNQVAFDLLLPVNSFLHRGTAFEHSDLVEVFEGAFKSSNIFEPFAGRRYNTALTGLINEGKFPHANESADYDNAIRNFVRSWLQEAGDAASDAHAMNFFNAVRESTMGQQYEIPEFDDDTMINVLTSIIFTVTCYHELVGHVVDYKDTGLRITSDGVVDLQSSIYWYSLVAFTSLRMPMLMDPFENYFSAGGAPDWERVLLDGLHVELAALSQNVAEAGAQREVEFKYCDPNLFECSLSV